MKNIPVKSYGSIALSTTKSSTKQNSKSVYERQMMYKQAHERKLEAQREEQALEQARRETLETTFKPKINNTFQPRDSFFERQQKLLDKRKQREEVLAAIQQETEENCTFEPTLNPVSLYIVEQMQKQRRYETRSLINQSRQSEQKQLEMEDFVSSMTNNRSLQNEDKVLAFTSHLGQDESVFDKLYKSQPKRFQVKVKEEVIPNSNSYIQTSKTAQLTHVDKMLDYQRQYQRHREELQKRQDAELAQMKRKDPDRAKQLEEMLQRRQKRIDEGTLIPRRNQPQVEQKVPKTFYNSRAQTAEDFLTRVERYEKQKQDKLKLLREEKEREIDHMMRQTPHINRKDDIHGNQMDVINQLLKFGEDKRKRINDQQQKDEDKKRLDADYVTKKANSFKANAYPTDIYRENLLVSTKDSKQNFELQYQLKDPDAIERLKIIGNGNEVIGYQKLDSTYKFINRIRNKEPEKVGLYGQQNPFIY